MTAIPLALAFLCECGLIGDSPSQCACGNAYGLLRLSAVLNRESHAAAPTDAPWGRRGAAISIAEQEDHRVRLS